ncbi:hypothetical protein PO124_14400 [Bacillus licheniformis]|nr:hypothetical protein [Bacillus licheniformis]
MTGKGGACQLWGLLYTVQRGDARHAKAYDRFKGDGFEIIAVNVRESKGAVKSFVDRHGLTFRSLWINRLKFTVLGKCIICLQVYSLIGKGERSECMSEECLSGKLICGLQTFLAIHRNSFKGIDKHLLFLSFIR